jgi:hypothetical protein
VARVQDAGDPAAKLSEPFWGDIPTQTSNFFDVYLFGTFR